MSKISKLGISFSITIVALFFMIRSYQNVDTIDNRATAEASPPTIEPSDSVPADEREPKTISKKKDSARLIDKKEAAQTEDISIELSDEAILKRKKLLNYDQRIANYKSMPREAGYPKEVSECFLAMEKFAENHKQILHQCVKDLGLTTEDYEVLNEMYTRAADGPYTVAVSTQDWYQCVQIRIPKYYSSCMAPRATEYFARIYADTEGESKLSLEDLVPHFQRHNPFLVQSYEKCDEVEDFEKSLSFDCYLLQ